MPRKSTAAELQAEEAVAGSPLRRSSRILSGTATTAAGIGTRRSSQTTESQADTPAKATRGRRASTQDNEEKLEAKPSIKTRRASTLIDDEFKKETESTPSRRGRKPSVTTEPADPEESEKPKPVRRSSTAAKSNDLNEEKSKTAPVRGRRSSANLEAEREVIVTAKTPSRTVSRRRSSAAENTIAEAEATSKRTSRGRKVSETEEILPTPEVQKPATRSRRKSINVDESSKPEEKAKPTRGRRSSTSDLLTNISPKTPQRPRSRALENKKEDTKKSPEENKNDSSEMEKEITTSKSDTEETTPVIAKEILVKVTPLKKRKILEKIEAQLDLSVINESSDDINISKNDDSKLNDDSKCEDRTEYDPKETPSKVLARQTNCSTMTELSQEQTKNIDNESSKKVLAERTIVSGTPTTSTILQNVEPCDLSVTNVISNDPDAEISEKKLTKTDIADNSETNDQKEENVNSHNISEPTVENLGLNSLLNESIPLLENVEPGRKRLSPKLDETPSPRKSPRLSSPKLDDTASPRKSPRLSEKRSTSNSGKKLDGKGNQSKSLEKENDKDVSIKEKSQASFLSSGSDGSFRFHLSNISMAHTGQRDLNKDNTQEETLNTSNESNTSNKENIHQVDSTAQKELDQSATIPVQAHVKYRVSNVFKPNQKEYSFMEPMEVEEDSIICIEDSFKQNQNDTQLLDQTASENINDLVKEEADLDESSVIFNPKVLNQKTKDISYLSEDYLQNATNSLQMLESAEDMIKQNLTETEGSDTNLLIEETHDTVDFSIMPKKNKISSSDINPRRSKSPKNADTSLVINQHLEQVKIVLQGKSSSPLTAKRRTTSLGRSKSPIPKNTQSTDSENEEQNRLGIVKLPRRSKSASNSPSPFTSGKTKKDILSPTLQMTSSKGLDLHSKNLDIELESERLSDTNIHHVDSLKNSGVSPASLSLVSDTKELRNSSGAATEKDNSSLRSPVSDVKRNQLSQDTGSITPNPVQLESKKHDSGKNPSIPSIDIENEYTADEVARPITRRSQRSITRSPSRSPVSQDNKIVTPKLKHSEIEKNTTRRSSGRSPSFLGISIENEYTSDEAARPIARRSQRSIRSHSKSPVSQESKIVTPKLKHSELEKNTTRRSSGRSPSFLGIGIENEYTSDQATRSITRQSQKSIRSQSKSPVSQDNKIVTPKLKHSELEKNTTRKSSGRSPSFLGVGTENEYSSDEAARPITRRSQRSIRSQSKSPVSQNNKILTPKSTHSESEKNTPRRSSGQSPSFLGVDFKNNDAPKVELRSPITRENEKLSRSKSRSPDCTHNEISTTSFNFQETLAVQNIRTSLNKSKSSLTVLQPTLAKQSMSGDQRENLERLNISVTKDSATSNEKKEHGITAEMSDLNSTDFEQTNVQDKTEYLTAITTNNESDFNSCLIDNELTQGHTKLQEQTPSVIKDGESLYDFHLDSDDEGLHSKNGSQVVSINTSAIDKQTIANRKQAYQDPRTTTTTTYIKPQSKDLENQPEVSSIIVSQDKTADLNVKRSSNDLKTRPSLDEFASLKLQEYLDSKVDEIEDSCSDEMEEEESEKEYNEFIDGMAEEGEEDTPSEDSNQIIDEGESVGSSSHENDETDDDYDSNDSFICDEEDSELLSGEEYDLGNENKKKKKKSRIIDLNTLKDDEEIIRIPRKDKSPPKKKKSRIIKVSDSSEEEEVLIKSDLEYKELNKNTTNNQCNESIITIEDSKLEDITTSKVITIDETKNESKLQSVISEESQSLDVSQQLPNLPPETGAFVNPVDLDRTNNEVGSNVPVANLNPSFHNTPVANPNYSINNTSLTNLNTSLQKRHRKSSLSIQENILVDGRTDPLISQRINTLVQSFCSTVKKGEISLNLSLEYENNDGNSQDKDKAENRINILSDVKICPNNVILAEPEDPQDTSVSENTVETDSKLSVSFNEGEDLRAVINRKAIKRRLSRSVGDLSEELKETKRRKKDSANKANEKISNKKKTDKIRKQKKTNAKASKHLESDIFSFNIANQLITDVKNRPRRVMKPSILDAEAGNSWITSKVSNLKPSTSPVAKHEKFKTQPKIHPKDFKNQMLSSDTRVKRIDTKTLLKQKGAFN